MKAYTAILKTRFAVLFQYRSAALAGIATQIFWGIIKIMILEAFFLQSGFVEPITLAQATYFVWLGQAFLQLIPWNIDKELESQIRSGHVAYELLRPVDLYFLWLFRALASRMVYLVMRTLPLLLFALLFFHFPLPANFLTAITFLASLIQALFLSSAIATFAIITLFWTHSGEGIQRLLPSLALLLSGITIPLPLFPDWMQPFLNLQPFRGMIDIPCRIYTGMIPANELVYYLGFQLAWLLFFLMLGRWLLSRGIKQFVIAGG